MSQIKFVPISSFSEATAEIALSLKQQYQQLSGNTPGKYNPVAYALEGGEDGSGLDWYFKIDTGDGFLHLHALEDPEQRVTLHDFQTGKTSEDPFTYY